jgi:site-specific DNA-methyltransferase (adenine-specific)
VPRVRNGYPAEKPPELAEILITQSSAPGDIVADPFMGSGSVGVAALRLGRRFLGNDLNPEAVHIASGRLAGLAEATAGVTDDVAPAPASPTDARSREAGARVVQADLLSFAPERR